MSIYVTLHMVCLSMYSSYIHITESICKILQTRFEKENVQLVDFKKTHVKNKYN